MTLIAARALRFATATDMVECGPVPTGERAALTVECWARVDVIDGGNRPLLTQWPGWALYVTADARLVMAVIDADGAPQVAYSPAWTVPLLRWRHVAGVYATTGRLRVLLHGADVTEDGDGPYVATGEPANGMRIGGYLLDDALPLVGRIGWARVSAAARYGLRYAIPYRAPAVDATTLAQYDMQPSYGAAATVPNAAGVSALDGVIVGAQWTWGAQVGARRVRIMPRAALATQPRRAQLAVRRVL